ncbi:MAG: hypothetical protein AUJ12_08000 [Alphaproteobacteria bacterium CG1_02_46_17]|nr:MAG: hypothetical protein AUJ12_08000 [Alphaproteobacteria bacterium CG1_02_46_17]
MPLYSKHFFWTLPLCIAASIILAPAVNAQALPELNKNVAGMKKMVITPADNATKNQITETTLSIEVEKDTTEKLEQPDPYPPLDAKVALIKIEELKTWGSLSLAATTQNKEDADKLVSEIESHRDVIAPQGLFLAAKALSDVGEMEQASIYLFVAQLRLDFDKARWPESVPTHIKNMADINAKKSADQALPTATTSQTINPHSYTETLSSSISPPIFQWVIKDPTRFRTLLDQARKWDMATAYRYKPGYETKDMVPFEQWEDVLNKTRENYFNRMGGLQEALAKYATPKYVTTK